MKEYILLTNHTACLWSFIFAQTISNWTIIEIITNFIE